MEEIPDSLFFEVKYPGSVKNPKRAINHLGGISKISNTFQNDDKFLSLNWRSKATRSHALTGDVQLANAYLLEIAQSDCGEARARIIGRIKRRVLFQGLADYQMLKPRSDLPDPLSQSVSRYSVMEPPIFSRFDSPRCYRYLTSSKEATKALEECKIIEEVRAKDCGNARKRVRLNPKERKGILYRFEYDDLPSGPDPSSSFATSEALNHPTTAFLRKVFEKRPIWLFDSIHYVYPQEDVNDIRKHLAVVAYRFSSGPWRNSWIRYGYDPRKIPESYKYQTIDFRVSAEYVERASVYLQSAALYTKDSAPIRKKLKFKELQPGQNLKQEDEDDDDLVDVTFQSFPKKLNTFFQLCDIYGDEFQQKLASIQTSQNVSKTNGWIPAKKLKEIRLILKRRFADLLDIEDEEKRLEDEEKMQEALEEEINVQDIGQHPEIVLEIPRQEANTEMDFISYL